MKIVVAILGWIGAVLFLIAYALVSLQKVKGDALIYQGINIMAGIFLTANTIYWKTDPSAVLNLTWIGVSVFTLGRKYAVQKKPFSYMLICG